MLEDLLRQMRDTHTYDYMLRVIPCVQEDVDTIVSYLPELLKLCPGFRPCGDGDYWTSIDCVSEATIEFLDEHGIYYNLEAILRAHDD
jgi:hypothetical protein